MSRIMMVASEAAPFIKTGGLADVMGSLPAALERLRPVTGRMQTVNRAGGPLVVTATVTVAGEPAIATPGDKMLVGKDGLVDRRVLGGKVFGNPAEQERLQNIVWPEIRRLISEELREIKRRDKADPANHEHLGAPMAGKVVELAVAAGDHVEDGQKLMVTEAMKMLNVIKAPRAGIVARCLVQKGDDLQAGDLVFEMK